MTLEDAVPISFSSERAKGMKLMFKVVLRTNDANITPVVNFNKFDLFMSVFKTSGEYIQLPFTLN